MADEFGRDDEGKMIIKVPVSLILYLRSWNQMLQSTGNDWLVC